MNKSLGVVAAMVLLLCRLAHARDESLILPSVPEATDAIVEMLAGTGLSRPSQLKLGTCVVAVNAQHPGQVACTVSVTMGAAVSENQMDFYKQGKKWKVQPSESQDKLPFPDPALH